MSDMKKLRCSSTNAPAAQAGRSPSGRKRDVVTLGASVLSLTLAVTVIAACDQKTPTAVSPAPTPAPTPASTLASTPAPTLASTIADCPFRHLVIALSSERDTAVIAAKFEAFSGPLRFSPAMRESEFAQLSAADRDAIANQYSADLNDFRGLCRALRDCVSDPGCASRAESIALLHRWVNDNRPESVCLYFSESAKSWDAFLASQP